jgi:hypothetical protein
MTASILSHNGILTLTNPATGNHRTFRIKTVKTGKLAGKRILSMLIGPNNEEDYLGIGFVDNYGIQIWKKHRNTLYEKTAKCLLKIEELGLISQFATKCRVCNKTLSDNISISLGIGPVCRGEK